MFYLLRYKSVSKSEKMHNLAIAFNMTLAEFLDFDELNDYSFEDEDEE